MATSGNFVTSNSGQGGGGYPTRMIFEWWRTSWGLSGAVGYHNISYRFKSWDGNTGYFIKFYNGSMNVDGQGYSWGTTNLYGGGATSFGDYGKTLYTDSAGNRSFGASAQGGIYANTINTSGSGGWSLDNIPLNAYTTGASGNLTRSTIAGCYTTYANPSGSSITAKLYVSNNGGSSYSLIATRYNYPSGSSFALSSGELDAIDALCVNTKDNVYAINIVTVNTGTETNSWGTPALTYTSADAPIFTTATYKDKNSTTVAITGNDQYLVQGQSVLEAKIASGDKATSQKQATMTKYNMTIGSINEDVTYTTSAIAKDLGTLGINASANLVIKAIDSRGLETPVTLPVNVLPYQAPQVSATVRRQNNFETSTDFHIEGVISRLTIGGTDKNGVNSTSGVRYRYKKTTDVSWGSWVNVASSVSSGNVSTTDFNVATALDRNFAWNVQISIADKLNTTVVEALLSVGIPIFRIGLDGKVYNNEVQIATVTDVANANKYYESRITTTQTFNSSESTKGTISGVVVATGKKVRLKLHASDIYSGAGRFRVAFYENGVSKSRFYLKAQTSGNSPHLETVVPTPTVGTNTYTWTVVEDSSPTNTGTIYADVDASLLFTAEVF